MGKLSTPYKTLKDNGSLGDILLIYFNIFSKLFRGFLKSIGFKKKGGMTFIGRRAKVTHKGHISIGKNVKFEDDCEVQGLSRQGIKLGNNVTIGSYCMIRPSGYYGTDIGEGLEIGDNSSIGPYGYVGCSGFIHIGENVMFGPRVSLFAENHNFKDITMPIKVQGVSKKGIHVEDDCWIGSGCVILDGVTIGRGSVVGSGTVVSKSIPPYSVVVGVKQNILYNRKDRE